MLQHQRRRLCLIYKLCDHHKLVFQLWDGAFSVAHTINPTRADCDKDREFATAAMDCHVNIGCSVTHKSHLLLVHLLQHLLWVPHGLGEKTEDWVEAQH